LPAIVAGDAHPANPAETIEFAVICVIRKNLNAAAARLFEAAFRNDPMLAARPEGQRYNAACAAALAGCGHGDDANLLNDEDRARWRHQAAAWLRADLTLLNEVAQKPDQRQQVAKTLAHWLKDSDFSGVRDPQLIATRPEAERRLWESLWADVQQLLDDSQLPLKSN